MRTPDAPTSDTTGPLLETATAKDLNNSGNCPLTPCFRTVSCAAAHRLALVIELIAIDMDGTLLNPAHEITPRVRNAIAAARAKGIGVVLATGRPFSGAHRYLRELGIDGDDDYCICFNGTVMQTVGNGTVIAEFSLGFDDYLACEQLARELSVHFQAIDGHSIYTANADISPYTVLDAYLSHAPLRYRTVAEMDRALRFRKLMMIDAPEVLDAIIPRLPDALTQRYGVLKSAPFFLEIFHRHAGKGPMLQQLADRLGLAPEQIMAIGDHENDLTMLAYAGTSVAMGNAIPAVKATARYETASNQEDGVALAIERFAL
jgi:Cof subfamily protein (haloacid dehalogenase superfamily)